MPVRQLPRSLIAVVAASLLLAVACGGVQTAVCGLVAFTAEIQEDLTGLLSLDPELVAQEGTPENVAALAALDALDATVAEGQAALDGATDEEVGPVVREAFQAVLNATSTAATDLREAIQSGDSTQVRMAMEDAQLVADAIGAFQAVIGSLGIDCPGASTAPSVVASPSLAPSVAPSVAPTPTPTPEPTPTPAPTATPEPTPVPTATPAATPTATPGPTATPVPTATPTPVPTATPIPSPSASTSASASPEPSPAPSGEGDDEGGGLLPWIIVLGLLGTGAAAVVLWYNQRNQPPTDNLGGPDDLEAPPSGPPTAGPPPPPPPPAAPPPPGLPPGSPPAG